MKLAFEADLSLVPSADASEVGRKVQTAFDAAQKFVLRELALIDVFHPNQIQIQITFDDGKESPL